MDNDFFSVGNGPAPGQYPQRNAYRRPRRRRRRRRLPQGLGVLILVLCAVVLGVVWLISVFHPADKGKETVPPSAPPTVAEEPTPSTLPAATVEPTAPSQEEPPATDPAKTEDGGAWFADAVFIGDSRVGGLRLYSGITTEATFLDHAGLSIYAVANGKEVLPRGDKKVSVLDALAEGKYGKVLISLGVNELGYFDPDGFGTAYGKVIDAIRECQPDATVYVQALIPVNTAKCKEKKMAYYITNEGVASYNEALEKVCEEKDVVLLSVPETLLDENGETAEELTTDGVHFKKEGYVRWLAHLTEQFQGAPPGEGE